MGKKRKKKRNPDIAAIARWERDAFFKAGGSPQSWMGGRMWTDQNGRAVHSKTVCRKKVTPDD